MPVSRRYVAALAVIAVTAAVSTVVISNATSTANPTSVVLDTTQQAVSVDASEATTTSTTSTTGVATPTTAPKVKATTTTTLRKPAERATTPPTTDMVGSRTRAYINIPFEIVGPFSYMDMTVSTGAVLEQTNCVHDESCTDIVAAVNDHGNHVFWMAHKTSPQHYVVTRELNVGDLAAGEYLNALAVYNSYQDGTANCDKPLVAVMGANGKVARAWTFTSGEFEAHTTDHLRVMDVCGGE